MHCYCICHMDEHDGAGIFQWLRMWINAFLLPGFILDIIIVTTVKAVVKRQRPGHNQLDMLFTVSVDKFSFPSGHTTRAAILACFLTLNVFENDLLAVGCILWSAAVCLSRVFLGRHHVSDVLGGTVIGIVQYWLLKTVIWLPQDTCVNMMQFIKGK